VIIMPGRSAELPNSTARSDTFTGQVWSDPVLPATDGVTINTVFFPPGARTYWHHHEHGQILQVLAGSGQIRSEGGRVRELRAGDLVWVPPGERHWHGAGPGSYLIHIAISLGSTVWAEEVADTSGAGSRHE
jgi:quercetin dioxygenase-like cupin family protein